MAIHRLSSPAHFYRVAGWLAPTFGAAAALLLAYGLYGGLVAAPADYQQGDSYRIIFVHVPSAWMSMFVYAVMAVASVIALVWRVKLADAAARACAPIGASFTFLALFTGALWGKPMWGTYWVWQDARLVSELVLLFLYLGYMALRAAFDDPRTAARAAAILALVGVVNLPIIHYSVEWWHTLHQGPTVTKLDTPSIHVSMLVPLLAMALAFKLYFGAVLLARMRCEVLDSERRARWVQSLAAST